MIFGEISSSDLDRNQGNFFAFHDWFYFGSSVIGSKLRIILFDAGI